jgi:hypothetical protein
MGNFSRNTFDPLKNYVGVRLQQGVPVLDADWNELNDVTRQELYDAFSLTFSDGIPPGGADFKVLSRPEPPEPNDFDILAGAALVQGRSIRARNNLRYSTQPWTNPQRAARDGVAVIPPLTTPPGPPEGAPPRRDLVYLDVWEREVGSTEDTNLVNPAIGVETAVRLKRDVAVRVAEGTETLPPAPAGHLFLPLAVLRRPRTQAQITAQQIEDRRPLLHSPRGSRETSFLPAFLPVSLPSGTPYPEWKIKFTMVFQGPFPAPFRVPKFHASKSNDVGAFGVLPLILPDGAFLTHLNIRGAIGGINGELQCQLLRIRHPVFEDFSAVDSLRTETIRALTETHVFDNTYTLSSDDLTKLLVDNSRYYYALYAEASTQGVSYGVSIHGISLRYT